MNALRQIEAKLRRKRDRDVRAKPVISQHAPVIRARLPSYASELCDTCSKLLAIVRRELDERVPFPANVAELTELPPLFCPFCYLRWRIIPPAEREKLRGCRKVTVKFHPSNWGGVITILYSYSDSGSYFMSIGCQLYTNLALQHDLNSSSPSTFSIIANWIDTCHNKHEGCGSAFETTLSASTFPAGRVLDLKPDDLEPSESGYIRLVDGQGLEANSKYISLSHRWGSYEPLKLTKGVKEYFKKGINPQILPRTFADAIDITKRLGIKYLWIDCMCIVQDDEGDWKTESAKMAQIYECAWLNIAAVKAQDARGGCYAERETWDVTPLVVHIAFQRVFHHHYFLFDTNFWDVNIQDSSLMRRAWVQQEQFFSRRSLYFTQHQVFWRCQQLTACETFTDGMPQYGEGNALFRKAYLVASLKEEDRIAAPDLQQQLLEKWAANKDTFESHLRKDPPEDHPQQKLIEAWKINSTLLEIWCAIVGQYSSCELTFPVKDKLVAISGLARRCGRESDYLAGLWRSTLPWQLLWKVTDNRNAQRYSRLPGLPSWSWTSVHRGVYMHDHLSSPYQNFEDDQPLIKMLKAETRLVGDDPFGQVDGGLVTLSGFMLKTKISAVQTMITNWGQGSTRDNWNYDVYCEDDFGRHLEGSLGHYLAVLKGTVDKIEMNITALQGLWLEPTGCRHGEYRRRGSFVLPVETSQLWPKEFQTQLDQALEVEEYEQYEGMHSVRCGDSLQTYHRYRITLV